MRTLILLIILCLLSCEGNVSEKQTGYKVADHAPIKILEIDSCEYVYGDWGYATVLTHKGNCKYCEQRKTK